MGTAASVYVCVGIATRAGLLFPVESATRLVESGAVRLSACDARLGAAVAESLRDSERCARAGVDPGLRRAHPSAGVPFLFWNVRRHCDGDARLPGLPTQGRD